MIVAVVLSIAFPVCFVALLIGCLDCLLKKRRLEGFRSRDTTDGRHTNAFSVDICDVPSSSEQVTIEPLPDILSKVSAAPALRPQITFIDRGEHASTAPLISVQRSFPRDHLTYLNEIGSGWFGKAIESEAIQIVGGSLKSHVVVKMLKDDASKLEQKQFLDEVHAYRCLDHANLMSLLGQCTETTPFLVILEFAAYGSLKSFLLEHSRDLETLVAKNRYISFALDAAAGLACLHRHDYIHNDLAARNCLVMSDYTLKIGDYGISDNLFKNEYYNTGTELLPVRWMAPETLVKSNGVWTTQPHNKMSDMWSFGILLWEICSVGERPYDMLTDEAVLQGVVQDKLLLPSDVDMKLPFKDRLWSVMIQCWRDASRRLDVMQAYDSLQQLGSARVDTVDIVSDFDQKWNQLKQNQERAPGNDTDLGSRIALAGSFATDDSSSPPDKPSLLDSDGGAFESIRSDDLIIDVGIADEMPAPVYQSPAAVLANSVKATEIPVQAIVHRRISDTSEDQIFVENEFTNTSVLQSHTAPIKSVEQAAGTTGTSVFNKQSSRAGVYTQDSDNSGQTTAFERQTSPMLPGAKVKDINIVKNDLSLEVEDHSSNKLTSGAQEEDNAITSGSNFESHLLTDDEDFSDFVRTSPTAPSLDFTDFASADISAHDVHVDKDLQFENGASSFVPGADIKTRGYVDTPVGTAAENTSLDHDFDAFSDFVTSDPPHKFGTMEILTENLDAAASHDKSPGLTEKQDNSSFLDDNKGTSDSDSDTFSDFVSSVPTKESNNIHDAKLASADLSNSGDKDIASVSVLSSQDLSSDISFVKPDSEAQTQMENLSTAPPDSDVDLQMLGSLKDFGYDSETSSVAVDFDVEKTSGEKKTADHNQNIFSSELFPSDLSSLSSDMSLLIHDSVATSRDNVPVDSKQPEVDADIHWFPETNDQLPETSDHFFETSVQFHETDVHQLPETNVQFPETDVHQLPETNVQFPETDVHQLPETSVQFTETDVHQLPGTNVQFPETDVHQLPEANVQFSVTDVHQLPETNVQFPETNDQFPDTYVQFPKTDVQFPETDVQFPETDVQFTDTHVQFPETHVQLPETNAQFSETDVHQFPETDVQFPETDVQFPETDVQFHETDVQFPETDVHQFPETDVQFPETDVQFPETDVQFPETNVQFPETDVQFPETDVQFPETNVQFPETDVQFSENNFQFPETDVQFLKTDVQFPETNVQFFETDVEFPETDVQFPEINVQFPETNVQFPQINAQFTETDVQFPETDVHKLPERTNIEQQLYSPESVDDTDVFEQGNPSSPPATGESNNSLKSFDFFTGFTSVAAVTTDPAVAGVVVDVGGEKDGATKRESGSLDVQPGMSFDLLDSQLVQGSDTLSIMSVAEILGKQTGVGATEVEASTPQDEEFGFDLMLPAVGPQAQQDVVMLPAVGPQAQQDVVMLPAVGPQAQQDVVMLPAVGPQAQQDVVMPPAVGPQAQQDVLMPPAAGPQAQQDVLMPPAVGPQAQQDVVMPPAVGPQAQQDVLMPPAAGPQAQQDVLITDLHKSNGDANSTSTEQVEQPLISF